MAAFYDNSPGMVDDITPPAPAAAPPPAGVPAPPAPDPPAAAPPAPTAAEIECRSNLVDTLAAQADALPHGSEVAVHLGRAAEAAGLVDDEAAAVAGEWKETFRAHGISAGDAVDLITIGAGIHRTGPPDEATEAGWLIEVNERLRGEFGSADAAERAADLAREWVARDKHLCDWLERTRLGSHPKVVLALAKAAHNARKAGRF